MRGKNGCLRCKALREELRKAKKLNTSLSRENDRLEQKAKTEYVDGYFAGAKRLPLIR